MAAVDLVAGRAAREVRFLPSMLYGPNDLRGLLGEG